MEKRVFKVNQWSLNVKWYKSDRMFSLKNLRAKKRNEYFFNVNSYQITIVSYNDIFYYWLREKYEN